MIGVEVTGQPQYYNSSLARQRYCPSSFACERWLSRRGVVVRAPVLPFAENPPLAGSLCGGAAPQPGTRQPLL
jgi:hypothetical protein